MSELNGKAETYSLAAALTALLEEGAELSTEMLSSSSLKGVLEALKRASRHELESVALFGLSSYVQQEAEENTDSEEEAQEAIEVWIGAEGIAPADLSKFARRTTPVTRNKRKRRRK